MGKENVVYTHTVEYFSAIKKKRSGLPANPRLIKQEGQHTRDIRHRDLSCDPDDRPRAGQGHEVRGTVN